MWVSHALILYHICNFHIYCTLTLLLKVICLSVPQFTMKPDTGGFLSICGVSPFSLVSLRCST